MFNFLLQSLNTEQILEITTWAIGALAALVGFILVYRNLRKINLIEGDNGLLKKYNFLGKA